MNFFGKENNRGNNDEPASTTTNLEGKENGNFFGEFEDNPKINQSLSDQYLETPMKYLFGNFQLAEDSKVKKEQSDLTAKLTEVQNATTALTNKLERVTAELESMKERERERSSRNGIFIDNEFFPFEDDEQREADSVKEGDLEEGKGTESAEKLEQVDVFRNQVNVVENPRNSFVLESSHGEKKDSSNFLNNDAESRNAKRKRRSHFFKKILGGVAPGGNKEEGGIETDSFTMMMFSQFPSKVWLLGISTFIGMILLGFLVVMDQLLDIEKVDPCLKNELSISNAVVEDPVSMGSKSNLCEGFRTKGNFLKVPVNVNIFVTIAQLLTIPLALITQTDILTSMSLVYELRNEADIDWHKLIGIDESNRTHRVWLRRILLPNALKFFGGSLILFATWVIIYQSQSVGDLLKGFTALYAISSIDDIVFILAEDGYLGYILKVEAGKVKNATITRNEREGLGKLARFVMFTMLAGMFGGWVVLVDNQYNGRYFEAAYPECDAKSFYASFGNGICDASLNSFDCGYDGGDCDTFNQRYPSCVNSVIKKYINNKDVTQIGDGICDQEFNRKDCAYDGGDCVASNIAGIYPNCTVEEQILIGNGWCDGGKYNTEECGFDGGDCESFNDMFPNCTVDEPYHVGDKLCHGGIFNTADCNFDGGDCKSFNEKFPNCTVDKPYAIGNGFCTAEYNTPECGYDGGDCP